MDAFPHSNSLFDVCIHRHKTPQILQRHLSIFLAAKQNLRLSQNHRANIVLPIYSHMHHLPVQESHLAQDLNAKTYWNC